MRSNRRKGTVCQRNRTMSATSASFRQEVEKWNVEMMDLVKGRKWRLIKWGRHTLVIATAELKRHFQEQSPDGKESPERTKCIKRHPKETQDKTGHACHTTVRRERVRTQDQGTKDQWMAWTKQGMHTLGAWSLDTKPKPNWKGDCQKKNSLYAFLVNPNVMLWFTCLTTYA